MIQTLPVFRSESSKKEIFDLYDSLIASSGIYYDDLYVQTRIGETHVMVSGKPDNPPLILIHAFYASAASWYKNLKVLSENFRVYNVDIIGDPNKSRPYKIIRQVDDFVFWFNDLLDALGIQSANFIGNSVGAYHIANFALKYPERFLKMVLIGPAATFRQIMPFYLNTFPGGMTGWPFLVNHAVNWIQNGIAFDPEFRRLFFLLLKHGKATNQVFPGVFSDEELKKLKLPVLLLYGDKECIYNYELASERARHLIDNLKVLIIEKGNHITAASNHLSVNNAIIDFLKK